MVKPWRLYMKNVNKTVILVSFLTFAASSIHVANAANVERGVIKSLMDNTAKPDFLVNYPFDTSILEIEPTPSVQSAVNDHMPDSDLLQGPASGIDYFEIRGVLSENHSSWEVIPSWRSKTLYDHGGDYLYVAVLQRGYGNANPASMNGISKTPVLTERLCGIDLHICRIGETLAGYMYYYDYSGQQNGYFTASANSTAFPYGYWSDSLSIL